MALTFVDVRLAPRPRKTLRTVARKRAGRIHADPVMLARRPLLAFVNVLGAVDALVTGRTRTRERPIDRARVAQRVRMARIRCARIVQMAQQSGFTLRAATVETSDTIDARRPIEARRIHAVVNVLAAIVARPAVDANARIAARRVRARRPVLAHRRPGGALVDVRFAMFAHVVGAALAAVRIDAIDAGAAVLAQMAGTVVDVLLAVGTLEACGMSVEFG